MGLFLFYLFIALFVSFLCSLLEAVLLSLNTSYIESLVSSGKRSGHILRDLKGQVEKPLAAILSINTIAHTVGAAGVGAQASVVFEDISIGVISAILTFMILVFSEIIPKTVGATFWRSFAPSCAYILKFLVWISYPFVMMSLAISRLIPKGNFPTISRSELTAMAEVGKQEGVFDESESKIINNLLLLKNVRVQEVMTPRTVITGVDESLPLLDFIKEFRHSRFSRFPVYSKELDNVQGYVHKNDLMSYPEEEASHQTVRDFNREVIVIPQNEILYNVFELLLSKREHLAVVADDYGTVMGVVTLEDVLETLLGMEIVDEFDGVEDMQDVAKKRWKKKIKTMGFYSK